MQPHPTLYFRLARAAGILCLLAALILPPAGAAARPVSPHLAPGQPRPAAGSLLDETPSASQTETAPSAPLPTGTASPAETASPKETAAPEPTGNPSGAPSPTAEAAVEPSTTPAPDLPPADGQPDADSFTPAQLDERYSLWGQRPLAGQPQPSSAPVGSSSVSEYAPYCETTDINTWTLLVFMHYTINGWEIVSDRLCMSDTTPELLTENTVDDYYPRINNALTEIVFVSDRAGNPEIYTMLPDGSRLRRLTNHPAADSQPHWSPDGKQIVFTSDREGSADIYVMNRDGTGLKRLTFQPDNEFNPDWSPSGKEIAYARSISNSSTGRIYRMNADGSQQVPISPVMSYPEHPIWSPDGTWIAFDNFTTNGHSHLNLVQRNGSGLRELHMSTFLSEYWPSSWSEDGSRIYMTWVDYDNYGYIERTVLEYADIVENKIVALSYIDKLYMHADVHRMDMQPPRVTVHGALPDLSAADDWLRLPYTAVDIGPSGIRRLGVLARPAGASGWTESNWSTAWINGGQSGAWLLPSGVVTSQTYEICIYAEDNSANAAECPPQGHFRTRFYNNRVEGQVTDNRGTPLSGVELAPGGIPPVNPPEVSPDGEYSSLYSKYEPFEATFTRSGFAPQAVFQPVDGVRRLDVALLPAGPGQPQLWDLNDPSNPLDGWQPGGSVLPSPDGHTGSAVQLGAVCAGEDCLTPSGSIIGGRMYPGPDGSLHLLTPHTYRQRTAQGTWLPTENLPITPYQQTDSMVVDSRNIPHVLADTYDGLVYMVRDPNGSWTREFFAGVHSPGGIAVDSLGQVYILYASYPDGDTQGKTLLYILRRSLSGVWSDPVLLKTLPANPPGYFLSESFTITAGQNGTVWVVLKQEVVDNDYKLFTYTIGKDGRVTANPALDLPPIGGDSLYSAMDTSGRLRVLMGTTLLLREPSGAWLPAQRIKLPDAYTILQFAPDGTIYFIIRRQPNSPTASVKIYSLAPHEVEVTLHEYVVTQGNDSYPLASVSFDEMPHFMYSENLKVWYRTLRPAGAASEASLSRQVSIPAEMNAPTLSFFYRKAPTTLYGQPRPEVVITPQDGQPVTFTLPPAATNWQLGWVDLTDWLGQTVTVTVRLPQAAADPVMQIQVDEIALASYLVPGITSLAPARLELPLAPGAQVTLRGTGFMEGAVVTIGGQPVTVLSRPDSTTLVVEVPAGLEPGLHDVVVTNPGGYASPGPVRLGVGLPVFVPVIRRSM